jgi:hypothetical protein
MIFSLFSGLAGLAAMVLVTMQRSKQRLRLGRDDERFFEQAAKSGSLFWFISVWWVWR